VLKQVFAVLSALQSAAMAADAPESIWPAEAVHPHSGTPG